MEGIFRKSTTTTVILVVILCIYFASILLINFFAPPSYYDSDMYTDMRYAVEVWNHGTVFPEGWVFGNQLYVLATPVLAGLFYGLTSDPQMAMGLASSVMAAAVLLSFFWMLRPVIHSAQAQLSGVVLFLGLMLFFGDAWCEISGWQLLFTLCSYYSCYAVTAFLVFGCWLRSGKMVKRRYNILLAAVCFFSFGTGIQSLRQTAVMTIPLIGGECMRILYRKWKKLSFERRSFASAVLISAANILGVVTARVLNVDQVEIFGNLGLESPSGWIQNARQSLLLALSLVMNHDAVSFVLLAVLVITCAVAAVRLLVYASKNHDGNGVLLFVVLAFSILVILAVDTMTTMYVRSIYYFMLFPLLAFLLAWLYAYGCRWEKSALTVLILAVFLLSSYRELGGVCRDIRNRESESAYEVSAYMQENGYTTVYGSWNQGADVAVASDWVLTAGFWESSEDPFFFYKYLCNPEVFRADSEECVYLFYGMKDAKLAEEKARTKGIEMTVIKHFPDSDIYLYTAPVNMLEAFW